MRILLTLAFLVLVPFTGPAQADGEKEESDELSVLLEARREGSILPLYAILSSVREITGDNVVEIEFENQGDLVTYGIYYLTPEGLRREIYVNAQTGEVIPHGMPD